MATCARPERRAHRQRLGLNHVVIVKHEDEMIRQGGDVIEQGRQIASVGGSRGD
jgi:hypothetical protein